MTATPTVFVIDDEEQARESVCALVRSIGVNARAFASSEAFLEYYTDQPGCLVADYRMAGMNGLELQEALLQRGSRLPVIIVTAYARTPLTVKAVQNGAITLLDKPYDEDDLWQAIRKALQQDEQQRQREKHHAETRAQLAKLNDKEKQVLDLIVAGKPNKAMAKQLGVSVRTIENRRRSVYSKLEVETVAELVTLVLKAADLPST